MADPVLQDLNRHLADEADRECFGYAVEAVLDRWMGDYTKVANTLDDMMGTSDHTAAGYTHFASDLTLFVMLKGDADAVSFRATLLGMVRERLRDDAEDEVRRNDAKFGREDDEERDA